jgi:hypothetical protein
MHPAHVVQAALQLGASGYNATDIGRRLGVPWPTVRDWLAGKLPQSASRDPNACDRCGHEHRFAELPRIYIYLLEDIIGIFCNACDLIGVHWTKSGSRTIYVSRKADVARLDEFIGPKR